MGIFDLHVTSSLALYKMDWIRLGRFAHSNPHLISHLIPINQFYLTMLGKSTPYFLLDISLLPHSEVPLWKTYPHGKNHNFPGRTRRNETQPASSAPSWQCAFDREGFCVPGMGSTTVNTGMSPTNGWGFFQQTLGDCKVQPTMGTCDCLTKMRQRWDFMCISWV